MIPFSPPRIDEATIAEVVDTLRSGWITTGPKTKQLEKEISSYCGNSHSLCLNSWTAAAQLFLDWWGIKEGDEVIVPAYTYCATANIVHHLRARPVIVDVKSDFTIDVDAVKRAITSKTKAIIPVDIAGLPCDYENLYKLVMDEDIISLFNPGSEQQEKLGRILIFGDAAHSFGASYQSKMAGKFCDVTAFSFHAVKNLTTAEGGALTFNLPNAFHMEHIYKELNTMSLHGQNKDALAKSQKGGWRYDVVSPGYKCNMTDIHASIGLVEIKRYHGNLERRKFIHERYSKAFSELSYCQVPLGEEEDRCPSWHLYLLRLIDLTEEKRDQLIIDIESKGISVNVHFIPLPMLTAYKNMGYYIKDFPVSYDNFSRVVSLPLYYQLTDEQVDFIINQVKDVLKAHFNG
jgi:dTDP-4-amino-4,6-dideoxygalactose transaminase